ncbi:MAG: hypothetical protein P4L42_11615 [Desulfocapsaceae bacterium]|nr:hypothetical protein [Desulfocapsaceae bacterium]
MKILQSAFAGLVAGLILSLLASRSIWLEMRINTGLLLPLAAVCTILTGFPARRKRSCILGLEVLLVLLLLVTYGFDPRALLVVPAALFREGFFLQACDSRSINGILAGCLILGNSLLIPGPAAVRHWRRRRTAFGPRTDRPDPSP